MKNRIVQPLKNADEFTADSSRVANRMVELALPTLIDVTVCNYGVNIPSAPSGKEKIIFSNRLHEPLYQIDKIIEAFAKFRKTEVGPSWKLVIAGSGSQTQELKSLTETLELNGVVSFVGWLSSYDNQNFYAVSSVFVSIPKSDATSISLLEAMGHGCFPLVSDFPASREWVQNNWNGRLISDNETNFFDGIEHDNLHQAAVVNRRAIEYRANRPVGREHFYNLCLDMIEKNNSLSNLKASK